MVFSGVAMSKSHQSVLTFGGGNGNFAVLCHLLCHGRHGLCLPESRPFTDHSQNEACGQSKLHYAAVAAHVIRLLVANQYKKYLWSSQLIIPLVYPFV